MGWAGGQGGQRGGGSRQLFYLPRDQVLEAAQLVLVLRVVPGVVLCEEGLGRGDNKWEFGGFCSLGVGP